MVSDINLKEKGQGLATHQPIVSSATTHIGAGLWKHGATTVQQLYSVINIIFYYLVRSRLIGTTKEGMSISYVLVYLITQVVV